MSKVFNSPSQSELSNWSGSEDSEDSELESPKYINPRMIRCCGYKRIKDLEDEAYDLITKNDSDGLIHFLRDQLLMYYDILMSKRMLLEWAISLNADDCIIALIEEEIVHPDSLSVSGIRLIHYAAANFKPRLVEALLYLGSRTSTRCDLSSLAMFKEKHGLMDDPFNPEFKHMLPLEAALRSLCSEEHLSGWTAEMSVSKLVHLLCLPRMEEPLETIRMLAESTIEVREVALHIARRFLVPKSSNEDYEALYMIKETKLVELAVLLMVARKNILGPSEFHDEISNVQHVFHSEILRHIVRDVKLLGKCQILDFVNVLKKERMLMVSVLQLFEVFTKAGDAIQEYQRSQQPKVSEEEVAKSVCSILAEAGFNFDHEKTSSDIDRRSNHSWIDEESTHQSCYFIQRTVASYCGPWALLSGQKSTNYLDLSDVSLPFNIIKLSKQNFEGSQLWFHKMSETITRKEQLLRDFMPAKQLVKFAHIVKHGLRRL